MRWFYKVTIGETIWVEGFELTQAAANVQAATWLVKAVLSCWPAQKPDAQVWQQPL